jgi:hypothetical protein
MMQTSSTPAILVVDVDTLKKQNLSLYNQGIKLYNEYRKKDSIDKLVHSLSCLTTPYLLSHDYMYADVDFFLDDYINRVPNLYNTLKKIIIQDKMLDNVTNKRELISQITDLTCVNDLLKYDLCIALLNVAECMLCHLKSNVSMFHEMEHNVDGGMLKVIRKLFSDIKGGHSVQQMKLAYECIDQAVIQMKIVVSSINDHSKWMRIFCSDEKGRCDILDQKHLMASMHCMKNILYNKRQDVVRSKVDKVYIDFKTSVEYYPIAYSLHELGQVSLQERYLDQAYSYFLKAGDAYLNGMEAKIYCYDNAAYAIICNRMILSGAYQLDQIDDLTFVVVPSDQYIFSTVEDTLDRHDRGGIRNAVNEIERLEVLATQATKSIHIRLSHNLKERRRVVADHKGKLLKLSKYSKFLDKQRHDSSHCAGCNKEANKDQRFQRCSKCKLTYYCSRDCQAKHWKRSHKQECAKSMQQEKKYKLRQENIYKLKMTPTSKQDDTIFMDDTGQVHTNQKMMEKIGPCGDWYVTSGGKCTCGEEVLNWSLYHGEQDDGTDITLNTLNVTECPALNAHLRESCHKGLLSAANFFLDQGAQLMEHETELVSLMKEYGYEWIDYRFQAV